MRRNGMSYNTMLKKMKQREKIMEIENYYITNKEEAAAAANMNAKDSLWNHEGIVV